MAAVKITLGAALGPLQSGLRKAGQMLRSFGANAAKILAVGAAAGAALGTALAFGLKDAIDLGGRMSDLAVQIGATAGQTAILAAAFEANGMAAERMAGNINKMQKTIFAATQSDKANVFEKLGLDARALIDMDPAQAFDEVLRGLSGISNVTERTGIAMEIFGRSGAEMLRLLSDPEAMNNARKQLGGMADLLDENATKFDRLSDIMGTFKSKIQGFFVGIGSEIIDQLLPVAEYLNSLDFSSIGQKIGKSIQIVFQAFKDGQFGELVGLSFKAGLEIAHNYIHGTLVPSMEAAFMGAFERVADNFKAKMAWVDKVKGFVEFVNPVGTMLGRKVAEEILSGAEEIAGRPEFKPSATALNELKDLIASLSDRAEEAKVPAPAPEKIDPFADPEAPLAKIKAGLEGLVTSMRRVGGESGGREFDMGINLEKEQVVLQRAVVRETQTTNGLMRTLIEKSATRVQMTFG